MPLESNSHGRKWTRKTRAGTTTARVYGSNVALSILVGIGKAGIRYLSSKPSLRYCSRDLVRAKIRPLRSHCRGVGPASTRSAMGPDDEETFFRPLALSLPLPMRLPVSALFLASLIRAQTYSATYLPSNAPYQSERGQAGTNLCGTGANQSSECQNAYS